MSPEKGPERAIRIARACGIPLRMAAKVDKADEAYFGKPEVQPVSPQRKGRPYLKGAKKRNSRPIVSLVERGGRVRSFHPEHADARNVKEILQRNVSTATTLNTDESGLYTTIGKSYAEHATVKHSAGEYVRDKIIHTNTIEGYFSIFKRGMRGIYQHCAEKHLHRYLAEFDFRYNNRTSLGVSDTERATKALTGIRGKRLTYRRTSSRFLVSA